MTTTDWILIAGFVTMVFQIAGVSNTLQRSLKRATEHLDSIQSDIGQLELRGRPPLPSHPNDHR